MDTRRTTYSPISNDGDLTGNELRARRAWNTTPNTSYSSSVTVTPQTSMRKRSESRSSKSDSSPSSVQDDDEPSVTNKSSPENSPLLNHRTSRTQIKRRKEYTYIKIEEPPIKLKDQLHYNCDRFPNRLSLLTPFCISALIILLILWFYPYFWTANYVPCQISTQSLVKQLSLQFPNQPKRLWAQLRVALESRCSPLEHVATMERTPVVLLLAHHKGHAGLNYSTELFDSFVSCLGRLVTKLVPSRTLDDKNCLTVTPPIDRHRSIRDAVTSRKAEEIKWAIDANISSSYESGIRCFHFEAIDLLPADTVVLFHGVADSQNSLYKEAIMLFTLDHTFEYDGIDIPKDDVIDASHHRALEHQVQRYLRSIWEQHLGNDEVNALLSRLTPNIGVFYTNTNDLRSSPDC